LEPCRNAGRGAGRSLPHRAYGTVASMARLDDDRTCGIIHHMCCFSRPVKSVSATNIFARVGPKGNQVTVYSMTLSAAEDLAMILPIPVKQPAPDNGVRFVNLEGYPKFFSDMQVGFVVDSFGPAAAAGSYSKRPRLEVHRVGKLRRLVCS
jgi:hypothetical protein